MTSRRTIVKMGVWAVPVATIASAAPAFATSNPDPTPQCVITGERWVGNPNGKTFIANLACTGAVPYIVKIGGIPAIPIGNGKWKAHLGNSGRYQTVKVYELKNRKLSLLIEARVDFDAPKK